MNAHLRQIRRGALVMLVSVALLVTVAAVPAQAAAPPTVSSFNPTSGSPGTLVSVIGSGFTGGTGVTSVTFNGVATTFNVADDQHLTATVPLGATSGKISVANLNGTGTSATDFIVSSMPVINGFSPASGVAGTAVTINGSGFTGVTSVKFNGVPATFNFLSDAQVATTVPVSATNGKITLTTPSGTATSSSDFMVVSGTPPTISSFSPMSGAPGTSVTINGNHLTGATTVKFNGVAASFVVVSDAKVTATVPFGASNGKITLTTPSGTATSSSDFTVTAGSSPTISSFSPSSGAAGTLVTINGSHFTGATAVRFNGVAASFTFVNDGRLTASVPAGATTGHIAVTTGAGTATSSSNFTVTGGSSPTISSFSPSSGAAGTLVTINGSHLTGVNSVKFNGTSAGFTFVNDGRVTATVPFGATTGRITLTTAAGTVTSASNFTVTGNAPAISSFSPSAGAAGTLVTINGSHFTGVNSVRFNGTSAGFTFVNDGRVTATVPSGATTGQITVTTLSGTATSSSDFKVTGSGGGTHERTISLDLSSQYATGGINVVDGYAACSSNVPVVIMRFRNGEWHWVTTTSTSSNGRYRALIGRRHGSYRSRAKRITLVNGSVCGGDRSPIVHR